MSAMARRTARWRAFVDALRLVWPVTGGYRLLVPRALQRFAPRLRRLAIAYRRRVLRRTTVVAVIGSLGKTTTARAVATATGTPPPPQAGNFGPRLSLTVLRIRPWQRTAVVEAGIDGPGQMAAAAGTLSPDIVVVTSIRSDHHRSFDSIEHKADEKAAMVRALPADGIAVLNGDDPLVRWMATQTTARVVTFGMGPDNDVRGIDVTATDAGLELTVHVGGATRLVRTRLLGRHMAPPVLAALAVADLRGVPIDDAVRRLEALEPPPGRLEITRLDDGVTVVNDAFKGSMESIEAALEAFARVPATRRFVVLGSIEDPEGSAGPLYRALGPLVARAADRVVMIGSRGLTSVVAGAVAAGAERSAFTYVGSAMHDAIELLRAELAPGDAVLIKGSSSQRLDRVSLALRGRDVRCPVKVCQVPLVIRCTDCPMLRRDDAAAFDNVHVQRYVRL